MTTFKQQLIDWIMRVFPTEAARNIIHYLRLVDLPTPPRLPAVNKWGLRMVYAVLIIELLLLLVWLGSAL